MDFVIVQHVAEVSVFIFRFANVVNARGFVRKLVKTTDGINFIDMNVNELLVQVIHTFDWYFSIEFLVFRFNNEKFSIEKSSSIC